MAGFVDKDNIIENLDDELSAIKEDNNDYGLQEDLNSVQSIVNAVKNYIDENFEGTKFGDFILQSNLLSNTGGGVTYNPKIFDEKNHDYIGITPVQTMMYNIIKELYKDVDLALAFENDEYAIKNTWNQIRNILREITFDYDEQ